MCKKDLNRKVKQLRKLKVQRDELEAMIETLQDEIKAEMTAQETDTLIGTDWKVTWKIYSMSRIDTTAFRVEMPELADRFTKTSSYKRFCVS